MMLTINQLPDLCLLAIFNHLPVVDLMRLGSVCTRWRMVQLNSCSSRNKLTILITKETSSHKTFNSNTWIFQSSIDQRSTLKLVWLNKKIAKKLIIYFVQLQSVELILTRCSLDILLALNVLLQNCAKQLFSLKIYCHLKLSLSAKKKHLITDQWTVHLLPLINSMIKLKQLTICFGGNFISRNDVLDQIQLPILNNLTEFNFYSHDTADRLYESFQRYLPSSKINHFQLFNTIDDSLDQFIEINSNFADRIATLCVNRFDREQLWRFCVTFNSLTTLTLNPGRYSLVQVVNILRTLKQLKTLRLVINFDFSPTFSVDNLLHPVSAQIAQLNSIQSVHIVIPQGLHSHNVLHSRHLCWIFPELLSFTLEYPIKFRCDHCITFGSCFRGSELRQKCIQQLWRPWKLQCTNLRDVRIIAISDHYHHHNNIDLHWL